MLETLFLKHGGGIPPKEISSTPITSTFSMDNLLNSNLVGKLSGQKNIMLSIKKESEADEEGSENRDIEEEDSEEDGKWRSEGEDLEEPQNVPENHQFDGERINAFNQMILNSNLLHRNSIYSGHHNPNLCSLECCRHLKSVASYHLGYGHQEKGMDRKIGDGEAGGKPPLKFSVSAILGNDHRMTRSKHCKS